MSDFIATDLITILLLLVAYFYLVRRPPGPPS